jgi:endonuclease YncB( thermonuclease family)
MMRALLLFLAAVVPSIAEQHAAFTVRVVAIADGDTLTVLRDGVPERVRLHGIDAREMKRRRSSPAQSFAQRSKECLGDFVFGGTVTVEPRGRDRYKRMIATLKLADARVANREMVRAGLTWWFVKYAASDVALHREHLGAAQIHTRPCCLRRSGRRRGPGCERRAEGYSSAGARSLFFWALHRLCRTSN